MRIKKRYGIELITIVICVYLFYFHLVYSSDIVKTLRYKCTDLLSVISSHLFEAPAYKDKLAIIAIDEKSLSALGINLPLKRDFITKIIEKLGTYNPQLIFLNFLLIKEPGAEEYKDLIFATTLKNAQNVALPIYYDITGHRLGPSDIFEKASYKVGFINKIRDWDSCIRRCMLFHLSKEGKIDEYAMELSIASESKNIKETDIIFRKQAPERISGYEELYRKNIYKIPALSDGSIYINYQAQPSQIRTISLTDFIKGRIKDSDLKDKIVIVADVTETASSIFNTPLGIIPGIYIFANELIMFLSESYIHPLSDPFKKILTFLLMIGIGFFTLKHSMGRSFFATLLLCLSVFICSFLIFKKGILIDYFSLTFPLIAIFILTGFFRFLVLLEEKVDELRNANIKLQDAQQELIKKEQLSTMGKMTAKILHEIKSPLANIKSAFEIIKAKPEEGQKNKRIVQLASDEIDRLIDLSQQLRETYTPHSEDMKPAQINTILQDAIDISRKRFAEGQIEVIIKLSNDIPSITVSPSKMKQVFLNILNNAFEAAATGGKVTINSRLTKSESRQNVVIEFNNTGSEIPKDNTSKIFDAFFTTKKDSQGSGLGLFICKEIIKAHKGDITVESNAYTGTTFTISLPVL